MSRGVPGIPAPDVADGAVSAEEALADALTAADGSAVALTGAGMSVASDVPAFRGGGGLWERFDPVEHASLSAFRRDPARVWAMLRELDAIIEAAEPNAAHRALADLQRHGLLGTIVTQNVDGLHQAAGSTDVVEVHGSRSTLTCLSCGHTVPREAVLDVVESREVPRCGPCGGLLKPDAVLFGERLPEDAVERAEAAVEACSLLLVVGTSVEVHPVADLPARARRSGAALWEVNPDPAVAGARAVPARAEEALPRVVQAALGALG